MDMTKFRVLLDERHDYPCSYSFKFIVKTHKITELKAIIGQAEFKERPSKQGTYLGLTVTKEVHSTDQILEVYTQVSVVEGLMSM